MESVGRRGSRFRRAGIEAPETEPTCLKRDYRYERYDAVDGERSGSRVIIIMIYANPRVRARRKLRLFKKCWVSHSC